MRRLIIQILQTKYSAVVFKWNYCHFNANLLQRQNDTAVSLLRPHLCKCATLTYGLIHKFDVLDYYDQRPDAASQWTNCCAQFPLTPFADWAELNHTVSRHKLTAHAWMRREVYLHTWLLAWRGYHEIGCWSRSCNRYSVVKDCQIGFMKVFKSQARTLSLPANIRSNEGCTWKFKSI